jgi:SAM-dependent methyltransferase
VDGAFDLAISEYGAAIWCDPFRWIPEAARVLRPGGRLIFLGNAVLLMLCAPDRDDVPATDRLLKAQRSMGRFEWPDQASVEFHISHGDMIRLLRGSGFDVEDLIELYPPDGATTSYGFVDAEWAARWPSEEVWNARRR